MAQVGYTPISLYYSATPSAAPSAGNLANGELALNVSDGKLYYKDNGGVVQVLATKAGASGDVVGPASSTDNALVRFDGTTGKLVQSSVGVLSDAGALSGLTGLTSSGSITFSGLTSGRLTYATTGGLLTDSANLTFDGTTLTANALTVSNSVTLSGGTANGVAYLNGSKVLTTGSALTFDGTTFAAPLTSLSGNGVVLTVDRTGTGGNDRTNVQFSNSGTVRGGIGTVGASDGIYFNYGTTEAMRLTSTGLGIGTSSPGYKLDVSGAVRIDASVAQQLTIGDFTTLSNSADIYLRTTGLARLLTGGGGSFTWGESGGSERMRLDSSGNLGLGVTPSAWYANRKAMQIGGGVSLAGISGASAGLELRNNAYLNASGSEIYLNSDYATLYASFSGQHRWYTAPSGTAGNAISFTQAMTLDASGNLLVGTTSAPAGGPVAPFLYAGSIFANITAAVSGASSVVNVQHFGGSYYGIMLKNGSSDTSDAVHFRNYVNTQVGAISTSSIATSYNTSSDYRLKNITGPITNSGAYIDSLNPVEGTWKADGSTFVGLIAHEVQEASRTNVATGVKDGPEMQGMDYSSAEIIANLIAEVKSLRARVAALEAA